MNARAVFDRQFAGRWFQVYSVIGGQSLTSPASFNNTHDALERMDASSAMDIREVK